MFHRSCWCACTFWDPCIGCSSAKNGHNAPDGRWKTCECNKPFTAFSAFIRQIPSHSSLPPTLCRGLILRTPCFQTPVPSFVLLSLDLGLKINLQSPRIWDKVRRGLVPWLRPRRTEGFGVHGLALISKIEWRTNEEWCKRLVNYGVLGECQGAGAVEHF